jgi:glycosyltransferase involved in cell wall biosynthesis
MDDSTLETSVETDEASSAPQLVAPTFSVLIPVYNGAGTIAQAVASALEQTLPPVQVIVCDDGSTDDLDTALAPFETRIITLRQPNSGAAVARNRALKESRGEFIGVLDADDVWEPTRLERLGALSAEDPELDILASDVWFERDGRLAGRFHEANPFPLFDQRSMILRRCFMWNPAMRRTCLVELGGFDPELSVSHDWDCLIRLILVGRRAGLVDEPLARYRLNPGSLTAARARSLEDRVRCLEKASGHHSLSPRERALAEHSLRQARARARYAAPAESASALRRLLAHATRAGSRLRARAAALARGR